MNNVARIVAEVPTETKHKLRMLCMWNAEEGKDLTIQAMVTKLIEEEYEKAAIKEVLKI